VVVVAVVISLAMVPMIMAMPIAVPVSMTVSAVLVVAVSMTASEEFEDQEHGSGRDQQAAHDQAFAALDDGAELQADTDDDRAQDQRQCDMGQTRQTGQPQHPTQRVALGSSDHRQGNPVIWKDGVAETDAGRGGEQCRGGETHTRQYTLIFAFVKMRR